MKPFQCKDCGQVLGCHDHRRFVAGGAEVCHAVKLNCTKCGKQTQWNPSPLERLRDRIREKK